MLKFFIWNFDFDGVGCAKKVKFEKKCAFMKMNYPVAFAMIIPLNATNGDNPKNLAMKEN